VNMNLLFGFSKGLNSSQLVWETKVFVVKSQ